MPLTDDTQDPHSRPDLDLHLWQGSRPGWREGTGGQSWRLGYCPSWDEAPVPQQGPNAADPVHGVRACRAQAYECAQDEGTGRQGGGRRDRRATSVESEEQEGERGRWVGKGRVVLINIKYSRYVLLTLDALSATEEEPRAP